MESTQNFINKDYPISDYPTKDYTLPYQSDSSNDSAITCEYDADALQREIIKQNGYYEDDRLNSNSTSDFKELVFNFTCLALENPNVLNNYRLSEIVELIRPYYKPIIDFDSETQKYTIVDRFGFVHKEMNEKEVFLQQVLIEILNSKSEKAWTYGNCENLKTLVREYGIPNEMRPKIWLIIIKNKISNSYNIDNLLELAQETIHLFDFGVDEMNIRQIDLDICRTMPNHQMFNEKANGLDKLKRILVAYSIHVNPNAMNFLAALLLIIFNGNEKHALMGLICIIDYCFPPNYFDDNLTGARADQMLLRDLILKKLASRIKCKDDEELQSKLQKYSGKIDEITGSLSLNWFLSLFHNAVPWQTRLYILDCFFLEGMKVLFRFGLALLPLENKLSYLDAKEGDNRIGDLINQMKEECTRCHDVELLRTIAFRQLTIPGRRELRVKRSIYLQRIQESLLAAKHKEEKQNELNNHNADDEIDMTLDETDEEDKKLNDNVFRKSSFRRSNSASIHQQPSNKLNWLKKRLSLVNFYPMQRQEASAQKNAIKGLNGIRSCEAISRNGERIVQMISSLEHHQSRVLIQLRDTQYSHLFYPNRRSSIVLTDNEQHQNSILNLRNLYNKDLLIVGVSDDGKWIVLLDQNRARFHSGWLKDSNINVLILSVPFSVKSWYFDELSWKVICLDKENQLWRCDLADPSKSSLCTDFLKKQLSQDPKLNNLNMLAYDDKYCLLWVHMVTKISAKDQTEEALKRSSLSERLTLSLDSLRDEDEDLNDTHSNRTISNNSNDFDQSDELDIDKLVNRTSNRTSNGSLMNGKKDDQIYFKSSLEDLEDEDEDEDDQNEDQNDLCSCSTESNHMCDHLENEQFNDNNDFNEGLNDETFRTEYLENSRCVKNCTEKCVSNSQNFNEPITNRLLSRRVTMSTLFRRNSLIILDSSPAEQNYLTDYLINKHGHANLSNTAKDQLKEQKEFQCTVRFALENRIRMHKLFERKQLNNHHSSHRLQTQLSLHSQKSYQSQQLNKPRARRQLYHQENFKSDDLTKIDTNENLTKQQLFVFDTCSMELFGILKLEHSDGLLKKIFCLGGVAYCAFEDGSIVAITVTLSGDNEQPTNRRQLLQPQPEDEILDLRVFSANQPVRMDTIIQQTLNDQLNSRTESMSSKDSISSPTSKMPKNCSSSIDEDDDEELVHFDAILSRSNSKKNSISNSYNGSLTSSMNNSITNSVLNSIGNSKENLKKTSSNSSSDYSNGNEKGRKKFESLSQDGTCSTAGLNLENYLKNNNQNVDFKSELSSRCSRTERNLPSLAIIFNQSVNSAFLVLALYKSGKLHCIYLKNGCVQERKLFRIEGQLKNELPIDSLQIVNAWKMNWSNEEDDVNSNDNLKDLINNNLNVKTEEANHSCSEQHQNNSKDKNMLNEEIKSTNNKSADSNNNEIELNNNEPDENNRNQANKQTINETELNGKLDQVHLTTVNEQKEESIVNKEYSQSNGLKSDLTSDLKTDLANDLKTDHKTDQRSDLKSDASDEFDNSKSKLSNRSSINTNQCNYLVTLWCPHPLNNLVNVKL